MENKTIESQYAEVLAFKYNKKDELIKSLTKSISLYKNCKNPTHPKVIERIKNYQKIIDYANENN